jgi:hypothetical protein
VSVDEHCANLNKICRHLTPVFHLLACRFADDIFLCLAVPASAGKEPFDALVNFFQNNLYEKNSPKKNLIIKIDTESNKYLDSDVIVYNNRSRIKVIYHNKNKSIIDTDHQVIGRFHDNEADSSNLLKINAISTILVRIHDSTTFEHDMITAILELYYELKCLKYTPHKIESAITKAARSRPNQAWNIAKKFIKSTSHIAKNTKTQHPNLLTTSPFQIDPTRLSN